VPPHPCLAGTLSEPTVPRAERNALSLR
jgi:hypothetical protein